MSDGRGSIRDLLANHARIAVDSNVLIYLLEGDPERRDRVARIVDAVATGEIGGVLSSVGLAEVLVGPARDGDGPAFEMMAATLRDLGFRLGSLDAETAEDAAWIRGMTGASLADAAHLAIARAAGATAFVTNDRAIVSRHGLEVHYLDDLREDEPAP